MEPPKRTRLLLIGFGVCAIVLGFALALIESNYGQVSDAALITQGEDIPIYAHAQDVRTSCLEEIPGRCSFSLKTADSLEAVVSFYEQHLTTSGWARTEDSGGKDIRVIYFVWTGSVGDVSLRRILQLAVDASPNTHGTEVVLSVRRWPDANKVPLYPGAQHVETTWEEGQRDYGFFSGRVTRFVTRAAPSEVAAYYKKVLVEYGWWMIESAYPGITFVYHGAVERGPSSFVSVSTQSAPEGGTKVQLLIGGEELRRPEKKR